MKVILASASPRRKEILQNTKLNFDIQKSDIEEVILENESPEDMVVRLAYEKAFDVAKRNTDRLVIGADTIVALDNEVLGKPKDQNEAYQMIKRLSNKTHKVITGISLINLKENKIIKDYVVSFVTFKDLSEDSIKDYINTTESLTYKSIVTRVVNKYTNSSYKVYVSNLHQNGNLVYAQGYFDVPKEGNVHYDLILKNDSPTSLIINGNEYVK